MGLITDTEQDYYEGETGGYRFISLKDIVNNFMLAYVGDGKDIDYVHRGDVLFHAKRGIQEFSYDISRVEKIQEVTIPSSLSIPMPQAYVNKQKICWIDNNGIEHIVYESRQTSKPSQSVLQDDDAEYLYDVDGNLLEGESVTNSRFNEFNPNDIADNLFNQGYYTLNDFEALGSTYGQRYGLDPETSQRNGVYIIDEANGKISFSSNLVDKIVNIHYISDGLGTDAEMKVHKYAEEAIYLHIAHAILSTKLSTPEYKIRRYGKKKMAAKRNAKIRLSNYNKQEMLQTLRGKSRRIK